MSNSSVRSILDMPDEILVMIILHFDARERLALANSCERFNDLVFGDTELLRNLDFTDELGLTKESDIQKYFDDENTYKKILRLNIDERAYGVKNLRSLIGKAINLVELNILHALQFQSVEELSRFLKPLVHLKRLTVYWPNPYYQASFDDPERNQVLEEPFSRLTYLCLGMIWYTDQYLLALQHCQQLEELSLFVEPPSDRESLFFLSQKCGYRSLLDQEFMKLSNLKFVKLLDHGDVKLLRNDIMSIVPDPTEWTDYYPKNSFREIHLERNIEVCPELERVKKMPLPPYIAKHRVPGLIEAGWSLVPEHLLSQVIRVTHEDAPEKFCCFSWPSDEFDCGMPRLLEIDEAKKLLKDPEYQISSLHLGHCIHKNCDLHLLASAFPNLTRLFLDSTRHPSISMPRKDRTLHKRLRKKGSLSYEEEHSDAWNTDSSFEILVKNTPCLEVLEINLFGVKEHIKHWDLGAVNFISGWKNLTVIRLYGVPMTDAKFLIDIGKECKKLEEVKLHDSIDISCETCCYENEVLEMLQHCKNLRKLDIESLHLERLSEMFNILSNRSRLVDLRSHTYTKECDPRELTSSVEKMLRQCQELKRFKVNLRRYRFCDELKPDVDRVISKSNRSNFEFRIYEEEGDDS